MGQPEVEFDHIEDSCGGTMTAYKQTYDTYIDTKSALEARIWDIINVADQYDDDEDNECKYISRVLNDLPDDYKEWDITLTPAYGGIQADFFWQEPYEDWTEERSVNFTWEEMELEYEGIIAMWKERGEATVKQEEASELRTVKRQAELLGYALVKEEK